jgi:hypothetical protein
MLELLSPDLLFNKQKVFHLNNGVLNTITEVNKRKAVVVYDSPAEVLPQPIKEMLDKLIQACQFKPEETIYLNARFAEDTSLGLLQNQYSPVMVLVFGEPNISRNLPKLKKNYPYELSGVKVINAESLETLVKNDAAKKVLWGVLKKALQL